MSTPPYQPTARDAENILAYERYLRDQAVKDHGADCGAVRAVLDLCNEWDDTSKGASYSVTTAIRAAIRNA